MMQHIALAPVSPGGPERHIVVHKRSSGIGFLTIVFFLLLPVEGILRKWVFSDLQQVFGFVRDPVLLGIYIIYFINTRRKSSRWLAIFCFFVVPFIVFVLLQAIISGSSPVILILGIRSYVVYVPLAFIIGGALTEIDFRKFLVTSLYVTIPVALLVIVQFFSPVESSINKGTSDDIFGRFIVVTGIVRPYGPFTFAQAQNVFAALMLALLFIAWDKRKKYAIPLYLFGGAAFATMAMGALSGGRTYFGSAILISVAYVFAGLTVKKAKKGLLRLITFTFLLSVFVFVFVFVFPTSFAAMTERQDDAVYSEGSTVLRALRGFGDFVEPMNNAPLLGYGVGAGSNAALLLTGQTDFVLGETEWGRMVNELGPLVGLLAIFARITLTAWLGLKCLKVHLGTGDSSALIMFGFSGNLLLISTITGQNQLLSFCWLTVGLTLSLCRLARDDVASA